MDVYTAMGTAPDPRKNPAPPLPQWCRDELDHRATVRRRVGLAVRVTTSTALLSGGVAILWTSVLRPPPLPAAANRAAPASTVVRSVEPGPPVVVDYTPTELSRPNPVLPTLVDSEPTSGPIIIDAFPDDEIRPEDFTPPKPSRPSKPAKPNRPAPPRPRVEAAPEPPRPRATQEQARPAAPPVKKPKKKRKYRTADEECIRTYKDPRLLVACLEMFDRGARLARSSETPDEPLLPGGLDGTRVVVGADVRDGLVSGNAVDDGEAGEGEARPPDAAAAPELDAG